MSKSEKIKMETQKQNKNGIGVNILGACLGMMLTFMGVSTLDIDLIASLMFITPGVIMLVMNLDSIIRHDNYVRNPSEYNLCKRCGSIIKKDKIFCGDCRHSLRRLNKYEEDKKLLGDYKKVIEIEKKLEEKKNGFK